MPKIKVNEGYELYQVIKDFGDPLEIFREGIQNAFDEEATKIYINIYEKKKVSGDELIIDILDNGNGLLKENAFQFLILLIPAKSPMSIFPKKASTVIKGMAQKCSLTRERLLFAQKH